MKCQGGLEKCFNTTPDTPTGRGWVLALPVSPNMRSILTTKYFSTACNASCTQKAIKTKVKESTL